MNFAVFLACRKLPLVIGKRLNALCQRPALKSPLLRWDSAERPPPPHPGQDPLEGVNQGVQPRRWGAGLPGCHHLALAWTGGFGLSLARRRCCQRCRSARPGALAGRVDTDAGLFEVKAAPGTGVASSAASCRAAAPGEGRLLPARMFAPGTAPETPPLLLVLFPLLGRTVSPEPGTPSLSHPARRPRRVMVMEIPNRPVSNFESRWRGGDVGGTGPARWKAGSFRAELLLTQPGRTHVALPAAISFSRGSSASSSSSSPGQKKRRGKGD